MPRARPLGAALLLGAAVACAGRAPAVAPTSAAPPAAAAGDSSGTFANPVVRSQAAGDPWVVRHGGFYYFTATLDSAGGLWVWRSPTLTGLDAGRKVKVWTAPASGPLSRQIWAPELYPIGGRWYLYFTASDGVDDHHRHWVLESEGDDAQGPYRPPVRVDPAVEHYAIDGSLLRMPDGRLYFLYCANGVFIAPMSSPTRVSGPGVKIIEGTEPWEHGWRRVNGRWERDAGYWVEAPEAVVRDGRVAVVYSAGHTATPHYYLGVVTLDGTDPLDPAAWRKRRAPIFAPYEGPDGRVYTPGHNSFTVSPDGTESWIVYHARDEGARPDGGNDHGRRTVRIQPFTWNADGTPALGHPIPSGVRLRKPSGEPR